MTNWADFDSSNPSLFAPADTPYYGDGYFEPEDVYLTAATNQTVTIQVRAWYNGNGAYTNYAQALAAGHNVGESNPVEIILAYGSTEPTPMIGLQQFTVGTFARQLLLVAPQWVATNLFQFNYTASPGLTYVVQRSSDLRNWSALNTNVATTNLVVFQDFTATNVADSYRVMRLPTH